MFSVQICSQNLKIFRAHSPRIPRLGTPPTLGDPVLRAPSPRSGFSAHPSFAFLHPNTSELISL